MRKRASYFGPGMCYDSIFTCPVGWPFAVAYDDRFCVRSGDPWISLAALTQPWKAGAEMFSADFISEPMAECDPPLDLVASVPTGFVDGAPHRSVGFAINQTSGVTGFL